MLPPIPFDLRTFSAAYEWSQCAASASAPNRLYLLRRISFGGVGKEFGRFDTASIIAGLLLVSASNGVAHVNGSEAEAAADQTTTGDIQTVAAGDDELICRKTKVTGSKFKKRICATQEQWDRYSQKAQREAKRMQDRGKGTGNPYGG